MFKVGDMVKVIQPSSNIHKFPYMSMGNIVKVAEVSSYDSDRIMVDGTGHRWFTSRFELVKKELTSHMPGWF